MKKHNVMQKIFLLLLAVAVLATPAQAQKTSDNYITEALAIARLAKINKKVDTAQLLSDFKTYMQAKQKQQQKSFLKGLNSTNPRVDGGEDEIDDDEDVADDSGDVASELVGLKAVDFKNSELYEKARAELRMMMQLIESKNAEQLDRAISNFPDRLETIDHWDDMFSQGGYGAYGDEQSVFRTAGLAGLESEIIYGITDFAISRAKEEILEAHLNYIYDEMSKDSILMELLPHTLAKMKDFVDDNSISLARYGGLWRAAFQEDLRNLPIAMQSETLVKDILTKINVDPIAEKQLTPIIAGGDRLIYNLYLKKHLVQILADMAYDYERSSDMGSLPVFKRLILMANVTTNAFGHMTDKGYSLATLSKMREMRATSWDVFLKLVYLRNRSALEKALGEKCAAKFVDGDDSSLRNELIHAFSESLTLLHNYEEVIPEIKKGNGVTVEDISRLYDLQLEVVDNGIEYLKIFSKISDSSVIISIAKIIDDYDDMVKPMMDDLSEIGEGLSAYKYGKVLDGTLNLLNKAHQIACRHSDDNCSNDNYDRVVKYLTKYGSFMVNVLDAKNSDDVKSALDEIIPRGLYKMKFAKKLTITASMYPGGFVGSEQLTRYQIQNKVLNTSNSSSSSATSMSFYLPIGIDFNYGFDMGGKKRKSSAVSLYLQAFDLGAVMNYRLNADSTESSNPQISFQQLISPGASILWHWPNSPLVIGFGGNYTPALRRIEDNNVIYEANALRYGGFIAVDVTAIPIFLNRNKTIKDK